jgi:uncharacterized LabA/DUF88 family protein
MQERAVFIDLPNFYSALLRSSIADPRELRDYFLEWLDLDCLAYRLAGDAVPTWVFYSGRRFGPSSNRIQDSVLEKYIKRINRLPGVTAWDVEIPGSQREPISYTCEKCSHTGTGQFESEKGIDASLIVNLFDTSESWETAYLISGDADFAPAIASLRRRGKIVVGGGFLSASAVLLREFYHYQDLLPFVTEDFAAYQIFKTDGVLERWLTEPIPATSENIAKEKIKLYCHWQRREDQIERLVFGTPYLAGVADYRQTFGWVRLADNNLIDRGDKDAPLEQFAKKFPQFAMVNDRFLLISPALWRAIDRRLPTLLSKFKGTTLHSDSGSIEATHVYNPGSSSFEFEKDRQQ